MPRIIVALALIVCLAVSVSGRSEPSIIKIDPDYDPAKLPYRLVLRHSLSVPLPQNSMQPADINGDGQDEMINFYNLDSRDGYWRNAVVAYTKPAGETLFQLNGCFKGAHMANMETLDLLNGPGNEIICVKDKFDSIFFEISSFDSNFAETAYCFLADVASEMSPGDSWKDLLVHPLAGIDINGDGHRDLIYSQCGKMNRSFAPDSGLARGIIAYDLINNKRIWFFPTADGIGEKNVRIASRPDGSPVIIFATPGFSNSYAANGMESRHSYLLAIDINGREIWRKQIGDAFLYPGIECLDWDDDGILDIYYISDAELDPENHSRIVVLDQQTGNQKAISDDIGPGRAWISKTPIAEPMGKIILAVSQPSARPPRVLFCDKKLCIKAIIEGCSDLLCSADLDRDGHLEYILSIPNSETVILDADFNIISKDELSPHGYIYFYNSMESRGILISDNFSSWSYYEMEKRPILTVIFARFKWAIIALAAAFILGIILIFARWIYNLYLSSIGIPTLDRINAMATVLDRKGKIIYANNNLLTKSFLGNGFRKKANYRKTELNKYSGLIEAIDRSYREPYSPLQARLEIGEKSQEKKIEVVIYPQVDRRNNFIGKILIVEEIGQKADWERKVVLGEAAQRWMHKLKGNMATARIILENIQEDRRLAGLTNNNSVLCEYLAALKTQIAETAEATSKILKFAKIGKPRLQFCDINRIVDKAATPYIMTGSPDITVTKIQQEALPLVQADPDQIGEALGNLLSNAVVAVKNSGNVTIMTRMAGNLHNEPSDGYIDVVVEDDGCGIEADDLERIFSPGFSRAHNGTGIGLAIVKEIIDNHGWKINLESKPGRGSRFTIRAPLESKNNGK
jgi:signal transduction histidine kinase